MIIFNKTALGASAILASIAFSGAANAATCTSGTGNQLVNISVSPATTEACGDINNPGTSFMGYDKVGPGVLLVTDPFVSGENSGSTASFSFTLLQDIDSLFVFIKQATLGGFFKISGQASAGDVIAGNWFIDGPGKPANNMKKNEYSHLDIYSGTTPVPLPAAGLMLLVGLGGLISMKRRKKA